MDDFVFTFDVNPFISAIDQISQGFEVLKESVKGFDKKAEQTTRQTASSTTRIVKNNTKQLKQNTEVSIANFSENASKMINTLIKRVAALGAAYLGFKAMLKYIPEIGTAFQSMGNIFLRNFLWPLRQYLIPLLKKMLEWVRDNRAMFAKWGTVLANAFKAVVEVVKGLFGLVKSFLAGFSNTFKQLFGTTTKSISDVINILLFKVTVLAQFILSVLRPVFEKMGEWVATAAKALAQYFKGFAKGFGNITRPFAEAKRLIADIIEDIIGADTATQDWAENFRKAGVVIGAAVRTIISTFIRVVDVVYILIETLIQLQKWSKAETWTSPAAIKKQWQETQDIYTRFAKRFQEYGKDMSDVWGKVNAEIEDTRKKRKRETEIITTTVPVKEAGKTEHTVNSNVKVGDVRVYVTTPDRAEEVGGKVGKGISSSIHSQMKKNVNDAMLGVATQ